MKSRIKKIRKELDLTQQKFADKLGIKRNTIAMYEMGKTYPSKQTINSICREFNVNEEWLQNGTGEMFAPDASNEVEQLVKKYHLSSGMQIFIEKLVNTKPEVQEALVNLISETAAGIEGLGVDPNSPAFPNFDLRKLTIDEKVALYRRELEREEKKVEEKSEALQKDS